MIKFIMPLHRKAGMSTDEFRSYYETFHRVIGEKYLKGFNGILKSFCVHFLIPTSNKNKQECCKNGINQHRSSNSRSVCCSKICRTFKT